MGGTRGGWDDEVGCIIDTVGYTGKTHYSFLVVSLLYRN